MTRNAFSVYFTFSLFPQTKNAITAAAVPPISFVSSSGVIMSGSTLSVNPRCEARVDAAHTINAAFMVFSA